MAEFGMRNSTSNSNFQQGGGSVDWYTPSAAYSNYGTAYNNPTPSQQYHNTSNSFEDEPPLLEGVYLNMHGSLIVSFSLISLIIRVPVLYRVGDRPFWYIEKNESDLAPPIEQ